MKNEVGGTELLGALLLGLIVTVPFAAFTGWVLSIMWGWFIVPLGVVPISVWQGAGIALIWNELTRRLDSSPTKSGLVGRILTAMFTSVVLSLMALAFGAIYHGWMR